MNPREVLVMLGRLPIFASLSNEDALAVAQRCKIAMYKPGGVLFREGDHGDTLMLVLKGSVQVSCRAEEGVNVQVAVLKEGDVLGEMAVIDPAPRAATGTAITDTVLLVIDAGTLNELITKDRPAASHIMRTILTLLIQRFRTMDERVEKLFVDRLRAAEDCGYKV